MADTTKIQWADHTFNPWLGCEPVHTGCKNCYAQVYFRRMGILGTRRKTADANWRKPLIWNRKAKAAGERRRVFPSLCDPFEMWSGPIGTHENCYTMADLRRDFFALIDKTPNLDWLLLTKRPENVRRMWPIPSNGRDPLDDLYLLRENCWLIYSASDQETLERGLPHLLDCGNLAPVLGLSLEPLVGPVVIPAIKELDLVIAGGESGRNARPCDVAWIRSILKQCAAAGLPCYVKQLGAKPWVNDGPMFLGDPKGGDPTEWPEDLRVRQLPSGAKGVDHGHRQ